MGDAAGGRAARRICQPCAKHANQISTERAACAREGRLSVGSLKQWIDACGVVGNIAWPIYLFFLGRRDHQRDETQDKIDDNSDRLARVEGFLQSKGFRKY